MIDRIILQNSIDWVMQGKAARSAIADGIKKGDTWGVSFEDGSVYGVKCSGKSVRVYPQVKVIERSDN